MAATKIRSCDATTTPEKASSSSEDEIVLGGSSKIGGEVKGLLKTFESPTDQWLLDVNYWWSGGSNADSILQLSSGLLELFALILICGLCFLVRLFAVIRYESVIHEFDPYFLFRTTRFLQENGFDAFWNWFDTRSWYPLGRVVGQTLYPGLMSTSMSVHAVLHFFGVPIDIKDVCVFLAPIFSAFTAIAAYLLTRQVTGRGATGLFAALFIGICPAFLSRSVAGSYDNEAVAVFALVFAFYAYVKALDDRTILTATFAALAYFYMVVSWGGYIFVTNAVSAHCLALAVLNRIQPHNYIAFCVFYLLGTVLALNIPFISFGAVHSSEHMSSHGVFLFLNIYWLSQYLKNLIQRDSFKLIAKLMVLGTIVAFVLAFLWMASTGRTAWAGRTMTLLDPTYAAKFIPIIASVSEHQAPVWSSYIFDINFCTLLTPIGIWICFTNLGQNYLFVGLYAAMAVYFSGVMVRLMLILAPAAAVVSAIGLSHLVSTLIAQLRDKSRLHQLLADAKDIVNAAIEEDPVEHNLLNSKDNRTRVSSSAAATVSLDDGALAASKTVSTPTRASLFLPALKSKIERPHAIVVLGALGVLFAMLCYSVLHGVFASAVAYSHPSIVQSQHLRDGSRLIQDDFREAFYWFRKNTHEDARLMSWWDYGYQSCVMGDRTVIVDNNTWNNTHIATVGLALASPEDDAYKIMLNLDVDYVFVVFGGVARHSGDDINKFIWILRIAGGRYPQIAESDYLTSSGQYRVGADAPLALRNSLLYKLSYYRFKDSPMRGHDAVRQAQVLEDIKLKHLEEVYTTQSWMVRIYRVKKPSNRVAFLSS